MQPNEDRESGEPQARPSEGLDRRQFLTEAAGVAGVATVTYFWLEGLGEPLRRRDVEPTRPGAPGKTFDELQMRTMRAACDRLLPSEGPDSPGARDVNAAGYLDAVLAEDFAAKDKQVVLTGLGMLHAGARANRAAREFAQLPPEDQDRVLTELQNTPTKANDGSPFGHKWLKKTLSYVFEAFFGDPVHGGNPREIGWKWAGHKPGFPRPTEPGWRMTERDA